MNKISLYIFLILVYLGLSKSFSPNQQSIAYIHDEHDLAQYFPEAPLSLLLLESFQTGFLIHTYFHRYKAIYVFKESQEFIVRTSEPFWRKNLPNRGLSLLRRSDTAPFEETTTPVPPGSLFVGHPSYGSWETRDNGRRVWTFHNAYRNFPEVFYWGDFEADIDFYTVLQAHLEHNIAFYGLNKEFGTEGTITTNFFDAAQERTERFGFNIWKSLEKALGRRSGPPKEREPIIIDDISSPQAIPVEDLKPFLGERPQESETSDQPSIFQLDFNEENTDE